MSIECGSILNPPFGLIEFTGVERNDFLQRLLSNDVLLKPAQGTSAYYLSVQGRPLSQFWLFQWYESTWLVCPRSLTDTSLQEFDRMHFGEKLRMFDRSADWHGLMLVGPGRGEWLAERLGMEAPPSPFGFGESKDALWCRFPFLASGSELVFGKRPWYLDLPDWSERFDFERIQAARPWPDDWGEKTMMLEVAEETDYLDGKGCYPGQEVVARTLHRGHINRHITYLRGPLPEVRRDLKLLAGDKEAGWISSWVHDDREVHALAYLRREFWAAGTELQREDGGTLTVQTPRREE